MATTSYICQGIKVADQNVDHITVEVYLDQALTNIVSSKTSTATWDGSQYTVQDTPLVFTGLTAGTTYYMRAGAVAKASGAVTWSATYSTSSGVITVPTTTFSGTFTATVSGVTYDVTPASAPTTVDHYEAYWVKDGSTPLSNVHPMWSGSVDSSGNFTFFVGGKAGDSISAYVRTIGVGPGEVQAWEPLGGAIAVATEYTGTITGTFTGAVDSTATIDGVSAGSVVTSSITGTNVNLCPDSAFKFGPTTYWPNNINATYTAMGILNGAGANGGNALVYTLNGSNPPTQIGQGSFPISVTSQVYTLSGSVSVPSGCTVSNAEWHLLRADTLAELGNTPTQSSGTSGRSQAQISIPAGVSTVIIVPHWYGSGPSGEQVLFSCPQLEAGSVMTSYKDSLIDNQTGGLASTVPIQLPSGTLSPVGIGDAHARLVDAIPTKGTIHNTLIVSGSGTAVSTIDTSAVTGTQRNLVPDSDLKYPAAFWSTNNGSAPASATTLVQAAGGNAWKVYEPATAWGTNSWVLQQSAAFAVKSGVTYTASLYIDATNGTPNGCLQINAPGDTILEFQAAGAAGRVSGQFTPTADGTAVLYGGVRAGSTPSGKFVLVSQPQVEVGSVMTAYRPNALDDMTGGLPSGMPIQEDTGSLSTVNLGLQHRFNRLAIPGANQLAGGNTITGITRTQIELQELHDRASNLLYSQTEFDGRNNIYSVAEGAQPLAEVHDRAIGNLYDHTHLMGTSGVSGVGKTALLLGDLHDRVSATIGGSGASGLDNVDDGTDYRRTAAWSSHGNLAQNAGFEVSATLPPAGWLINGAPTLSWDTTTQLAGHTRSLKVNSPSWVNSIQQTVTASAGDVFLYRVTLHYISGTQWPQVYVGFIGYPGGVWTSLGSLASQQTGSTSFVTLVGSCTAPANTAFAGIIIAPTYSTGATDGVYEVGEVVFMRLPSYDTEIWEDPSGGEYLRMPRLNMDANRRGLIDFSQSGHLGKSLANMPDDAGSSRYAVLAIDTNRRPIIDGASSHVNWTQDYLPNGNDYHRTAAWSSHGNLVQNAGFEVSATLPPAGWGINSSPTLSWDTTNQLSGHTRSLIVNAADWGHSIYQQVTASEGDVFLYRVTLKYISGTQWPEVYIGFIGFPGGVWTSLASLAVQQQGSTTFGTVTGSATAPANTAFASLIIAPTYSTGASDGVYEVGEAVFVRMRGYGSEVYDDGANGFYRLAHVASDNTLHVSSAMNNQGSIQPTTFTGSITPSFSGLTQTTTITAGSIIRPDSNTNPSSTISVPASAPSTTTWNGVAFAYPPTPGSGTVYNWYGGCVYWNLNTSSIAILEISGPTNVSQSSWSPSQAEIASAFSDGLISLLIGFTFSTTATSGVGGGDGSGGGGNTGCPVEDQPIETRDRGTVLARDLHDGDYIETPRGWETVRIGPMFREQAVEVCFTQGEPIRVNESHFVYKDKRPVLAYACEPGDKLDGKGGPLTIEVASVTPIGEQWIVPIEVPGTTYCLGPVCHNVTYPGSCPEKAQPVLTQTRGIVAAADVESGECIDTPRGWEPVTVGKPFRAEAVQLTFDDGGSVTVHERHVVYEAGHPVQLATCHPGEKLTLGTVKSVRHIGEHEIVPFIVPGSTYNLWTGVRSC